MAAMHARESFPACPHVHRCKGTPTAEDSRSCAMGKCLEKQVDPCGSQKLKDLGVLDVMCLLLTTGGLLNSST